MTQLWRIRQGYQLCDARGELVAAGGEVVSATHHAVLAHPDIALIATAEGDDENPPLEDTPLSFGEPEFVLGADSDSDAEAGDLP